MTRKVFVVELTEEMAAKVASSGRTPASKRGAEFSAAWKMGKALAGYGESSPIFGLTRDEVYAKIETLYQQIIEAKGKRDEKAAARAEGEITMLKAELERRRAAYAIARATRKGGKK